RGRHPIAAGERPRSHSHTHPHTHTHAAVAIAAVTGTVHAWPVIVEAHAVRGVAPHARAGPGRHGPASEDTTTKLSATGAGARQQQGQRTDAHNGKPSL